jgi:zinc-ribbon domain
MSSKAEVLVDTKTGVKEQTWSGFSWPCLFLGVFWFLYKRLYGWAAITFLAAIVTGGFAWLIFPFFANGVHRSSLQKSGWLPESQANEFIVSPDTHVRCPDCKELVRKDANVCKHCHAKLIPQT